MTENIYVHIKRGSPFSRLRNVLADWANLHTQYTQCFDLDRIHFYTEQANCAVLSAAAWKQGFPSLSEFQHPKRHKHDRRINVNGRIDLYIYHNYSYYFESKKIEVNLLKPAKSLNPDYIKSYINIGLNNAHNDALATYPNIARLHANPNYEDCVMGEILFIVPCLKSIYCNIIDDAKNVFTKALIDLEGIDALAWCLPDGEEEIDFSGNRYLGIAMVIRNFLTATK